MTLKIGLISVSCGMKKIPNYPVSLSVGVPSASNAKVPANGQAQP